MRATGFAGRSLQERAPRHARQYRFREHLFAFVGARNPPENSAKRQAKKVGDCIARQAARIDVGLAVHIPGVHIRAEQNVEDSDFRKKFIARNVLIQPVGIEDGLLQYLGRLLAHPAKIAKRLLHGVANARVARRRPFIDGRGAGADGDTQPKCQNM